MDDKGVIEQLAEVDAQLFEQRRLLFVDQENDAINIDDIQLIVFHGVLKVDGKLVPAHQNDFFNEFSKDAFAAAFR